MLIAGIGSRKTPPEILEIMTQLGTWVREKKGWIRSGHCLGADIAFEEGAKERTIVYLPEKNFNNNKRYYTVPKQILSYNQAPDNARIRAQQSINKYHPTHGNGLSDYQRLLFGRNYFQIFGFKNKIVDAVVCWCKLTKKGKNKGRALGGTALAINMARDYDIPVINLWEERYEMTPKEMIPKIAKELILKASDENTYIRHI